MFMFSSESWTKIMENFRNDFYHKTLSTHTQFVCLYEIMGSSNWNC